MPDLCSFTDLARLIDVARFVDEVILFHNELQLNRIAALSKRAFGGVENPQHAKPAFTVGQRTASRLDAFEKLHTLSKQRLGRFELFGDALVFSRYRFSIHEVYSLIVHHQLTFRAHVIEHRHSLRSDDDQPLLFVRMQPAYEYVRANARGKLDIGDGHVGNLGLKVSPARRSDTLRPVTNKPQNEGDVVRREAP